jgi:hypothetical protein
VLLGAAVLTEESRYADEIQKACGGGFEVRRELGDVVAQAIELRVVGRCSEHLER